MRYCIEIFLNLYVVRVIALLYYNIKVKSSFNSGILTLNKLPIQDRQEYWNHDQTTNWAHKHEPHSSNNHNQPKLMPTLHFNNFKESRTFRLSRIPT